jgi:hypothetical protein
MNALHVNPVELMERLTKAFAAQLPILIKGAPGVGKSDIVSQAAAALGWNLIISHPVVSDPTDYKGQPWVVDGEAEFLPFGDLRQILAGNVDQPTVFFLDDLGQAPACVQAACMQLLLNRAVNGHKVDDKVVFVAATNRREDRAGVTGILEPVKSRFASIYELVPDVDSWCGWAVENDLAPEIVGYVRMRPAILTEGEATADIVNHPCPRTIAFASKLYKAGLDDFASIAGAVGEGAAAEIIGFIKVAEQLPDLDALLLDPEKAKVPTDPSARYAVAAALVNRGTVDNADAIIKYAMRLPEDISVFLVRDFIRKEPAVVETKMFVAWGAKHQEALM